MSRRRRINSPGTIHHVVNRGSNRDVIFYSDADRVEFGCLLDEIHERFHVSVIAYCLMSNHYHLILNCREGNLSEAIHHLQSVFASHVNQRANRRGPLFNGRFYSALIDTDDYLVTATRYVERNSLAIVGVDDPAEYRWSSVRARLGLKAAPTWLEVDRMSHYFPNPDAYARFLRREPRSDEPVVLDTDRLDDLASLAIALFADADICTAQLERTLLAALSPALCEANRSRLAAHLGFDEVSDLRRASRRAERRIASEPAMAPLMGELRALVYDGARSIAAAA